MVQVGRGDKVPEAVYNGIGRVLVRLRWAGGVGCVEERHLVVVVCGVEQGPQRRA